MMQPTGPVWRRRRRCHRAAFPSLPRVYLFRRNQSACSLVAPHDDFQQFLGGGQWKLAHSESAYEEGRKRGKDILLSLQAGDIGLSEFNEKS
jgi:hypothetical protein